MVVVAAVMIGSLQGGLCQALVKAGISCLAPFSKGYQIVIQSLSRDTIHYTDGELKKTSERYRFMTLRLNIGIYFAA